MLQEKLLRRQEVEAYCQIGRSTIYRLMRSGQFPTPIRIGLRAVRWRASDIEEYLAECPRATGDDS